MSIIKVSDLIVSTLAKHGIKTCFSVTGGGSMHLNHSFSVNKKIDVIYNHHEQASSIAAESYYRLNNKLCALNVTSGPGGTNAITGVYGAFVDSIGMIVLSGQVKLETTVSASEIPLRQLGDQELDIVPIIRSITKFSKMITRVSDVLYDLEKAIYLAKSGRPGPCWLDIPLDIQGAMIDLKKIKRFNPPIIKENKKLLNKQVTEVISLIKKSKRPVIYCGSGIRLSERHLHFLKLVNLLNIPVVSSFNSQDVIWENHRLYIGKAGTVGDRAGNFAVQNSDLLLVLGSRLNIRQVSYNYQMFAREAKIVWVDVDKTELDKHTVKPHLKIHKDLAIFLPSMIQKIKHKINLHVDWVAWCKQRKIRYPVVKDEFYNKKKPINPYCLVDILSNHMKENDIVVTANGTAVVITHQAFKIKKGQRVWSNSGSATMGYDLPAAIGACYSSNKKEVLCITGDGSIMMNLQELETIKSNKLPIKIIIINNKGYVSMFQTQKNFFNGKEFGSGPKSGVTFPSFRKIAASFNFTYQSCRKIGDLENEIKKFLKKSTGILEVFVDHNQRFEPKLGAKQHPDGRITSPPLEDLSPFLSKEELQENMIIPIHE